jgi:ComF family protein
MERMKLWGSLKHAFEAALDAIAPRKARALRTQRRSLEDIPLCPTVHSLLRASITTLADYRDPAVQDLVRSLKYDGSRHAAALAAGLLAEYLQEEVAEAKSFSTAPILLVPIPLHKRRARQRGFNQIEIVLRALPEEFRNGTRSRIASGVLERTRATRTQTHLSRSERLSNVAGAFIVKNPEFVRKAHVYLLDDVTTTGATLVNAATPLKRAGALVTLLALARA